MPSKIIRCSLKDLIDTALVPSEPDEIEANRLDVIVEIKSATFSRTTSTWRPFYRSSTRSRRIKLIYFISPFYLLLVRNTTNWYKKRIFTLPSRSRGSIKIRLIRPFGPSPTRWRRKKVRRFLENADASLVLSEPYEVYKKSPPKNDPWLFQRRHRRGDHSIRARRDRGNRFDVVDGIRSVALSRTI